MSETLTPRNRLWALENGLRMCETCHQAKRVEAEPFDIPYFLYRHMEVGHTDSCEYCGKEVLCEEDFLAWAKSVEGMPEAHGLKPTDDEVVGLPTAAEVPTPGSSMGERIDDWRNA